ncbi:hypothetical protein B0H21DRAFT_894211 [Amylocystis lapponica]|nr:hypothetical protein B0H21DRAFT_894211 [Amylocystis lapponica]
MSLVFPWPRSCKTMVKYTLNRVDDYATKDHFVIRKPTLHREGNSTTFHGALRRNGILIAKVICKFAYGKRNLKRLRHEATIYRDHLQDLRGKVVPRFYGLYEGEMENRELTGCLDTKTYLISALLSVHKAGVRHGDFREANVVFTPGGSPYIIDFDHAEVHHCELAMRIVIHSKAPHPEEFACDELFDACESMGLWTPRQIQYLWVFRPVEYAESAEKLASLAPADMDHRVALEFAKAALYDFWRHEKKRVFEFFQDVNPDVVATRVALIGDYCVVRAIDICRIAGGVIGAVVSFENGGLRLRLYQRVRL